MKTSDVSGSLDPEDWNRTREQAHHMLDDILSYIENISKQPVWQPAPQEVRAKFKTPLPNSPTPLWALHEEFRENILPYTVGNVHPGFMGWVHGGGNVPGMLGEMLAAGLNANCGGRDQVPLEVERQITHWMRDLFKFPDTASGLFVTGTSMANLLAVLIASRTRLGTHVREHGLCASGSKLRGYTSCAAHGCIRQAFDLCGLGTASLREIKTDANHRLRIDELKYWIAQDRREGLTPFITIGTAGTVDVGAIDALDSIASLCRAEDMWFHVDGAYGALGALSKTIAPLLEGMSQADSIAFDFHKWGQVPYDAGFLLVRNVEQQLSTFSAPAAYLNRETDGLAAGSPWPCDLGPDLSRGFRALKTWFTLKSYGSERLGAMIDKSCALAWLMQQRIAREPELELLAAVQLNIVCFRFRSENPDPLNRQIVIDVQNSGLAVPSSTMIDGNFAIRAAIVNHRTQSADVHRLIDAVLERGRHYARETLSGKPTLLA